MTIPLQTGIVYGPIASRRLGRSLGINILPEGTKVCNFNCPYCQYGWTPRLEDGRRADWPSPDVVARAADAALAVDPAVDRITLAGNGEPRHVGAGARRAGSLGADLVEPDARRRRVAVGEQLARRHRGQRREGAAGPAAALDHVRAGADAAPPRQHDPLAAQMCGQA